MDIINWIRSSLKYQRFYNYLRIQSNEVWTRLNKNLRSGNRLTNEIVFTSNFVNGLQVLAERHALPITVREAVNEPVDGNDIELYIKFEDSFYYFPIQAKKLYKSGSFEKLNHKDQLDNLVSHSIVTLGFPLYFLYNFLPTPNDFHPHGTKGIVTTSAFVVNNILRQSRKLNPAQFTPHNYAPIEIFFKMLIDSSFELNENMIKKLKLIPSDVDIDAYIKNKGWKYTGRHQPINGTPEVLKKMEKEINHTVPGKYLVIIGHTVQKYLYLIH